MNEVFEKVRKGGGFALDGSGILFPFQQNGREDV